MARTLTDQQFAYLLILPLLGFSAALVAYPYAYSFWLSLHNVNIRMPESAWKFVGADQYVKAFVDPQLYLSLGITLRYTFESVIVSILISLGIALLLNEEFRGRGVARAIVILPWALSEFVTGILWRYMFSAEVGFINGLLDTLGIISKYQVFMSQEFVVECLSVAFAWHVAPLGIFFFLAALQTVPQDLYNAAKIDGAGFVRRFRTVTFPFLRYATLIILMYATMEAARSLDLIFLMTGGGPNRQSQAMTYFIYERTFSYLDLGYGAAISYVLIALMVVITVLYFLVLTRRR